MPGFDLLLESPSGRIAVETARRADRKGYLKKILFVIIALWFFNAWTTGTLEDAERKAAHFVETVR